MKGPLTDATLLAVARLFDDGGKREPSHSEIGFQIERMGLEAGDPAKSGPPVGKAKRVRATLSWALEHDVQAGERLIGALIVLARTCGGFRSSSDNYVGAGAIENAIVAFRGEGFELTLEGDLRSVLLDNLSGAQLTDALYAYVRRAKRGANDAALVTGTGKDLLEATAAHVIVGRFGSYPQGDNFPTLLGQAFVALEFATPHQAVDASKDTPQRRMQRNMYEVACAVNGMRNKLGTGHGRPWLPEISDAEARTAIEFMGVIAEAMLHQLGQLRSR
jgi:hypothetical protein